MAADLSGKTVLVTGASNGIGKATARELARKGARVVMMGRNRERSERALDEVRRTSPHGDVRLILADLSTQAGVRQAATEFLDADDSLHVLVNNAGALFTSRCVTGDGIETTFATNHLSYFLLTHLLLDALKRGTPARIVNVSSRAHERSTISFADLQCERGYSPMRAYGQSKLANVLFTYELARRLEGTGITVNCLHPGVVRTGFAKNNDGAAGRIAAVAMRAAGVFLLSPEKGAETSVHLASSHEVEGITGKYFARSSATPSNSESQDAQVAARLWQVSEQLCGLAPAMGSTTA